MRVLLCGPTGSGKTFAAEGIAAACAAHTGCTISRVDACLHQPQECVDALWDVAHNSPTTGVCILLHGVECMPPAAQHQVADALAAAPRRVHCVAETAVQDALVTPLTSVLSLLELAMSPRGMVGAILGAASPAAGPAPVFAHTAAAAAHGDLRVAGTLFQQLMDAHAELHAPSTAI